MASSACGGLPQEDCAGSRKSSAARGVPWCSIWKKECWALLPGSPQITGAVRMPTRLAGEVHRLAVALHVELLQVGGEAPEPAVVRQHRERRQLEAVDVPDA